MIRKALHEVCRGGDVIREANFYALQEKSEHISASHMKKAVEEKIYRSKLISREDTRNDQERCNPY